MKAEEIAAQAHKKRMGMQRILASRMDAQKPVSALAVLRGGVSEFAVKSPEPKTTIDVSEMQYV